MASKKDDLIYFKLAMTRQHRSLVKIAAAQNEETMNEYIYGALLDRLARERSTGRAPKKATAKKATANK